MTPDEVKARGVRVSSGFQDEQWGRDDALAARICAALEPIAPPVDASYVAGWMAGREAAEAEAAGEVAAHGLSELAPFLRRRISALVPPVASPNPPMDVAQAARVLLAYPELHDLIVSGIDDRHDMDVKFEDYADGVIDRLRAIAEQTMTPMQRLLEAVKAGLPYPTNWRAFEALPACTSETPEPILAHRAYHGSTDAAISLCEAILPGAELMMYRAENGPEWMVNLGKQDSVYHAILARALLIAVLTALVEQETP